jgi:hypothetical protein
MVTILRRFASAWVVLLFVMGCEQPPAALPTESPPRMAVAAITVIDPTTDRWFTTARLYLKIESSLEPGLAQLIPVTVGRYSGESRLIHPTLFRLRPGERETLTLEWLDDRTLTSDQRAVLVAAIEAGGCLFLEGAQLLVTKRPVVGVSGPLRPLLRGCGEVVVGEAGSRQFQSFGKADFHVPDDPPTTFQAANVTTVTDLTRARAEIRFYYPMNHPR